MSSGMRNPNTKINEIRENIDLEYAEELKLNIRCARDGSHTAVLYCTKCEISQCKKCSDNLHAHELSGHEIVRLTQRPEPPIFCSVHPTKIAELICKEPNCEGMNKPICFMCQQYGTHKDHKCEILDKECEEIRKIITNSLKKIERKLATCDKNLNEYDKCISSYSSTDAGFWKTERDKIEKFYSDAKTSALKTFDDFANNRIETLKLLKNKYTNDKIELNNMSSELRIIEEMKKKEVIENGKNVIKLNEVAAKELNEPADLIPSECYIITHPNIKPINIEIDPSEVHRQENKRKTPAIYFIGMTDKWIDRILKSRATSGIENIDIGNLYNYEDGRSIIHLKEEPNDKTITLSQYKYVFLKHFWSGNESDPQSGLINKMENKMWYRIIAHISRKDWENKEELVNGIREIAKTDKRLKVIRHVSHLNTLDVLLQK